MNTKISFLGGGPFGIPIHEALKKTFGLVAPDQADIWVVASYGKILKKEQFSRPRFGTIVVHPSLLPAYRGASPIQYAILNGDSITGVTIIKMDELVDHGPIIAQKELAVSPNDRYATLVGKLAELSADILEKVLPKYIGGEIAPVEQDHKKAIFTKKLEKDDGLLDLKKPADVLDRQVRAYWPWPGSFVWVVDQNSAKKRLIVHQAHVENGKFVPDMVQLEGKVVTKFADFARGWRGGSQFKVS